MEKVKQLVAAVLVFFLPLFAIAACGSKGDSGSGSADDAADYYPVNVDSQSGGVTIDAKPERIVTVGEVALENLLGLQVEPTAALVTDQFLRAEVFKPYVDADYIDTSLNLADINFESIAVHEPDLIIAPDWPSLLKSPTHEKFQSIAPTLFFDTPNSVPGRRLEDGVEQIAQALNVQEAGSKFIAEYNQKAADTRNALSDLNGRTYSFGQATNDLVILTGGGDAVFPKIGFVPSAAQTETMEQKKLENNGAGKYPTENASAVDADYIILDSCWSFFRRFEVEGLG